jgi:MarR family transcriptional regulator for hemolysin
VLKYAFEKAVSHWVCVTHHSLMIALRDELAPHNITHRQTEILGWLALRGPLSQAELATLMMIEPPSLVGTLDRMEASRLLERKVCVDDRRKNMLHPLPAAEKAWKKIEECGKRIQVQATQGLSDIELATLEKLLTKVRRNFEVVEVLEHAS